MEGKLRRGSRTEMTIYKEKGCECRNYDLTNEELTCDSTIGPGTVFLSI
jgi:hypothetical protein